MFVAWLKRVTAIGQVTNHSTFTLTAEQNSQRRVRCFEALRSGIGAKNQRHIRGGTAAKITKMTAR